MSLFSNLLNLHSGSKPREDFFTEIVAYFLSLNNDILLCWLKHHSIISDENYSSINISTQQKHKGLERHTEDSRLDIVVELSTGLNTDVIFIESKIGSRDGKNALEKYADILSKLPNIRHRILIYITRDYDPKKIKTPAFNLEPKISFYQLRWHQFYVCLQQHATDILAQEILIFMRKNGMSHINQFSSVDLLTMVNFNKTLNLMEATLSDEIKDKFAENFGSVTRRQTTSLTQFREKSRYIIYTHFSGWNIWCGLGYFNLNPEILTDYPSLGIVLEVSPSFVNRQQIIESMRKVINEQPIIWGHSNLYKSQEWSSIFYRKSLQYFLSTEDHLFAIKSFFLESIYELKKIQNSYFDFPWKGVSIETVTEADKEDLDTSASSTT
ncbi:MAG: PD-(D/E)XK nuclease family protein [Nostoc sp. DedVER02]|uniref:PD-(D/E)XK nuclease family protein n=1 Tax=unclassified Nostoc TaxID=2593658 RepID=UPI002AD2AB50|nr:MULTISPECIES: PD-(D/E)XK nuclease family protein [unclassified Nostoc]MDZ7987528.1 PD-(D/E)XK nuclease family protein [Nostoc sp. DedVER02]MDZ8112651.1 PD-(D/E)XK nuclease family protein [Nostoc sp. DedVER01b]